MLMSSVPTAMSRNSVDLTLESDSDSGRPAPAGARGAPTSNDSDDSDVILVDAAREKPQSRPSAADADLGDEDLVITGATGQVPTRDLAHPRHACAEHSFQSRASPAGGTGSGQAVDAADARPTGESSEQFEAAEGLRRDRMLTRGAARSTPATAVQVAVKATPKPSSTCKRRPLPDPSTDRLAFELGVLRLVVKAARGHTIAELAGRLERFGFHFDSSAKPEDLGDRLELENLLDERFGLHGGKYKSKSVYLKVLPLPPPPEDTLPMPTERVRKVLVVDCLGRTPATLMGVRVPQKVKRAGLLAALAPMLRPLFSASCELLHLVYFNRFEVSGFKFVEPDTTLDDSFFENFCSGENEEEFVVYRTSNHPWPSWPSTSAGLSSAGAQETWDAMPVYGHDGGARSASSSTPTSSVPAWVLVRLRQFSRPPPSLDALPEERNRCSNTTTLTASLLVPLRKDHARGGHEAEQELKTALLRGLQPYRTATPLDADASAPVIIVRGDRTYMMHQPSSTCNTRWGVQGDSLGAWAPGLPIPQLTAVFAHDLPATSYRLNQLRTPAVDPSASPEALRQFEASIAEGKRREAASRKWKELPVGALKEIVSCSRRVHSEDKVTKLDSWCKVATDAVLLASSQPGADPRKGELLVKDDWPAISGKRDRQDPRFPLAKTMQLLVTGVADPGEQSLLVADAAAGGPSTSRGSGSLPAAVPLPVLQRRIQAERRRARAMLASTRELSRVVVDHRSIMEFMQSGERVAAQQPPALTVAMRPYQLQSLAFMLDLERLVDTPALAEEGSAAGPSTSADSAAGEAAGEVDPADAPDGGCPGGYRRLFWLPVTNSRGQRYWYSPVFERLTMEVPAQPIGGFLAEETGLDKTVEVIALTLANPPPPSVVAGVKLPCGRVASRATLVVCPVTLVERWTQSKTGGLCRIHPYHGAKRIRDPMRLATEFDMVVTTYQTLQSDHAGTSKNVTDPCQAVKWHRVVFDDGHTLKGASTQLYEAAVELVSDRKWLCTGTPILNAVGDLLGQFGAIHLAPIGKKSYFDSQIKHPFMARSGFTGSTVMPLLYALRHTMIRHTKAQNLGGEVVLQLPDKTETDVPVGLSPQEEDLYRKIHREVAANWRKIKAVGMEFVNKHLFTTMSMFNPLRRICSGGVLRLQDLVVPDLVVPDLVVPDPERLAAVGGAHGGAAGGAAGSNTAMDTTEVPVPDDIRECPICKDTLDQPVVTRCNHWFCRECLLTGWINASVRHTCPVCQQPVTVATLRRGVVAQVQSAAAAAPAGSDHKGEPSDGTACESKVKVLLAELRAMREADPTAKALVFTQFNQTLEWLKPWLIAEGFGHRTITGDTTQKKRTEAIDSFQRDPTTTVFLLSVRSGAVGIDLTAANHVFLLEPCMNPDMEERVIGRARRMGQQRPVVIKRLFVKGSIEERIMEVVKMRRAAGEGGSAGDKTDLRFKELELMFRDPDFPSRMEAGRAP
ncbi:hypothetical protein PLESTB_000156300 [Pleodorina starrii]|uniref:Uncharacterized protein n=1 Tax=Pleodorina starrii TaxID=330485 RepID=A0A9W6BB76_9CHLO|nr:hypothetical protein PLESTM_000454700 [Pleodorina starrii]GLC48859.1 hypothetical protein PLESTB_000156300 [Pleodorina starrii]